MLTLFGDETDDGHTYALGGWLITPIHYDIFEAEWRKMLGTITMPDGTPCPAFHASLMMNQRGPFAGWNEKSDPEAAMVKAFDAFDKATSVLTDRPGRFSIRPCAVAAEIPEGVVGADKDAIWLILFMKFFALVIQTFPAAQGITFVFDRKRNIEQTARNGYAKVASAFESVHAGTFLQDMSFVDDGTSAGVQAADLLLYEWRKRMTDQRRDPERPIRRWWRRIRAVRSNGALVRFDVAKHIAERNAILEPAEEVQRMLFGNEVGRD